MKWVLHGRSPTADLPPFNMLAIYFFSIYNVLIVFKMQPRCNLGNSTEVYRIGRAEENCTETLIFFMYGGDT